MKVFSEKKSGEFLRDFGFNIVESVYVRDESELKNAVEKIGFPCVVKVFGKKIIHKKRVGGVVLGVKNFEEVLDINEKFRIIKGYEGVVIQKSIVDKEAEFLVGLQKTSDFGHVVAFGVGGSDVEKLGKVDFRVCDFDKKEAMDFINQFFENLKIKDKKILVKILLRCCDLARKFSNIKELDINPLVISEGKAIVLDSRTVFEK